jgi:hypothetical protein
VVPTLYINYHAYFIIFTITNFFLILISTIILYFILIYISIIFYFSLCNNNKQNKICESQFLKINKIFPFYIPFPLFFHFPFFSFFLLFLISSRSLTIHFVSLPILSRRKRRTIHAVGGGRRHGLTVVASTRGGVSGRRGTPPSEATRLRHATSRGEACGAAAGEARRRSDGESGAGPGGMRGGSGAPAARGQTSGKRSSDLGRRQRASPLP